MRIRGVKRMYRYAIPIMQSLAETNGIAVYGAMFVLLNCCLVRDLIRPDTLVISHRECDDCLEVKNVNDFPEKIPVGPNMGICNECVSDRKLLAYLDGPGV